MSRDNSGEARNLYREIVREKVDVIVGEMMDEAGARGVFADLLERGEAPLRAMYWNEIRQHAEGEIRRCQQEADANRQIGQI
jgi:hypothetical protein